MQSTAIAVSAKPQDRAAAFIVGFTGWTLDAFDFFLVVFSLTAIGHTFGKTDAKIALALTATLAFRPVGSILFGLLADRIGRRVPLMLNLVLFAVVEVSTGLARNFLWFLIIRSVFGIVMGGQWGLGTSLAMEKVPAKIRGLLSGLLQQGYATGYLFAALAYYLMFDHYSWRPLFFLGAIPALLAATFVALRVEESSVWKQTRSQSWSALAHTLVRNWRLFLYITIFMMTMHMTSHGTQDMYPTFLQRQWGLVPKQRAMLSALTMFGAIVGGTLIGFLSDKLGRRRAMIIAISGALLVVPLWAFGRSLPTLVLGAFIMQFMVQGAWGVVPAHLSEMSPDSIRGFLPGFGYQCGVLLASAVVYVEAAFAQRTSYPVAMAATASVVLVLAAVMTLLGTERRATVFGLDHHAGA
ncbi:MAG: MFS transporter [Acidobacteriota bacterium]|nr:MFS transporter [Acidobacteriota bacterium]